MEVAAWLIKELDRPVNGAAVDTAEMHEYRLPEGASPREGETVVRIFYLPPQSAEDFYGSEQEFDRRQAERALRLDLISVHSAVCETAN